MQVNLRRRRSSSPDDLDVSLVKRSKPNSTHINPPNPSSYPVSDLPPTPISASSHHHPINMARPSHSHSASNGSNGSNGSTNGTSHILESNGAGPSTSNGQSHSSIGITAEILAGIQPLKYESSLVYEDDKDWAEFQDEVNQEEDVNMMDDNEDLEVGSSSGIRRDGLGSMKRMPIEREEIVRLALQALRDMGYE